MKSAIITGSTGLVGKAVAQFLSSQGVRVLCIGRRNLSPKEINLCFGLNSLYLQLSSDRIEDLCAMLPSEGIFSLQDCVFFHFAWRGDKGLTDGTLSQQMKNAIYASRAVSIAKKIGCIKFINCGSLEETYIEQILIDPTLYTDFIRQNYAIAKLASRDLCKLTAYTNKIDLVHTRLSAPVSSDFSGNNFIELNLRKIRLGQEIETHKNMRTFDIINVDEVAIAYFKIGILGKNMANYYIGSQTPGTLSEYFEYYKSFLNGNTLIKLGENSKLNLDIFDTNPLEIDTEFKPSESFLSIINGLA